MMRKLINFIKILLSKLNFITNLAVENLALRQQLMVVSRSSKRPQINNRDRLFLILLSRFWNDWQESLVIVKPDTVIRWHKKGFKLFWRCKSRAKSLGRPRTNREIRELIYQMAKDNPLLGIM